MITSLLGCLLYLTLVIWICFHMERERIFRQGFHDGYDASARDAAQWLRREARNG